MDPGPPVKMNPKDRRARDVAKVKQKKEATKGMLQNYQIITEVGNGVSSRVFSALHINTGEKVAVKKIKNFLENKHESLRILRQMLLLRQLKHPNIVNMKEITCDGGDAKNLSLILQYLPSDVKKIFKSNIVLEFSVIKRIIFQILLGLNFLKGCNVLHRDLKPQNVLVNQNLTEVKLCDFGLARAVELQEQKDDQMEMKPEEDEKPEHVNNHMKPAQVNLTAHVSTRWYRAPELIILERKYSNAIDIWSVGCIMGELMTMCSKFTQRKPMFPGKACYPLSPPKSADMNYKKINDFPHSVFDQLAVIFSIIGTPTDITFIKDERARQYIKSFGVKERRPFKEMFTTITPQAEDFLLRSLEFNPNKRMTISEAIDHPLFTDIRDDYKVNMNIKGEPINMQIEGIQIQQIEAAVLKQYQFYQDKNKAE